MGGMFRGCIRLTVIYTSEQFVTGEVSNSGDMFFNCSALVGGNGTKYDENHTNAEYARMDNPPGEPGYFTYKPLT